MKQFVVNKFKQVYCKHVGNRKNKVLSNAVNKKLSPLELRELKQYWGDKFTKSSLAVYEFYKGFGVFNPQLVPNNIYAEAERLLNPFRYSLFAQHKCCLKYFIPQEHRPKTIIQNIDNHYLDREDNVINLSQAVAIAEQYDSFMIKIAAGSGGGRGIRKVCKGDDVAAIFADYGKDFICQELLTEHPTLSRFNPECINTIRVLSLNINGRCSILSSFVRMGGRGSIVDNLHSEEGGGCLVGLNQDGKLATFGINKNYKIVETSPMGESFAGMVIEGYDTISTFIKDCHVKNFPFANLIGWDVIIDEMSQPIIIEINLDSADIAAHQIFNGPIYGDRTEEVLEYMKSNPQKTIIKM